MKPDLRVYLVSGDTGPGRTLADVAVAAAAGGATMIQVRDKNAETDTMRNAVRSVAERLRQNGHGVPVLVNDDPTAADEEPAAGLHLGPDDIAPRRARQMLGSDAIIGWSIHDQHQLADHDAVAACDYLAASPVWATPSKTDTTPPLGLSGVAALRRAMPDRLGLVAIGGITETNAADVIEAGADGIAVVSAICAAEDPEQASRRLRELVDSALIRRRHP